jgi:hypothetical protein
MLASVKLAPARSLFASLLLLAACGDDHRYIDHGEAPFCSYKPTDDPFYTCPSPLVCVSTWQWRVLEDAGTTIDFPIFMCRAPCSADAGACRGGEVCCAGLLANGQTQQACVPDFRCDSLIRDR